MVARGGGEEVGEMHEAGRKVQTSGYKIRLEDIMYNLVTLKIQYCIFENY